MEENKVVKCEECGSDNVKIQQDPAFGNWLYFCNECPCWGDAE